MNLVYITARKHMRNYFPYIGMAAITKKCMSLSCTFQFVTTRVLDVSVFILFIEFLQIARLYYFRTASQNFSICSYVCMYVHTRLIT